MKRVPILLTLLATATLLTSCGQKGPLRLPEPTREPANAGVGAQPTPGKPNPSATGDRK